MLVSKSTKYVYKIFASNSRMFETSALTLNIHALEPNRDPGLKGYLNTQLRGCVSLVVSGGIKADCILTND